MTSLFCCNCCAYSTCCAAVIAALLFLQYLLLCCTCFTCCACCTCWLMYLFYLRCLPGLGPILLLAAIFIIIIYNVKCSCVQYYYSFMQMESFCVIINIFTVTFDQFNASLLNKSIHCFNVFFFQTKQNNLTDPKFWYNIILQKLSISDKSCISYFISLK